MSIAEYHANHLILVKNISQYLFNSCLTSGLGKLFVWHFFANFPTGKKALQ
jgi:hypothetical protein